MPAEVELRDFISTCLQEIVGGIYDAQRNSQLGQFIVPEVIGRDDIAKNNLINGTGTVTTTVVEFDVAVTAESSSGKDGKAGVKVWGVGISSGLQSGTKDTIVSRILFGVLLQIPYQH